MNLTELKDIALGKKKSRGGSNVSNSSRQQPVTSNQQPKPQRRAKTGDGGVSLSKMVGEKTSGFVVSGLVGLIGVCVGCLIFVGLCYFVGNHLGALDSAMVFFSKMFRFLSVSIFLAMLIKHSWNMYDDYKVKENRAGIDSFMWKFCLFIMAFAFSISVATSSFIMPTANGEKAAENMMSSIGSFISEEDTTSKK